MANLTFYKWDGEYFVRTKSSLTRRKVLHSPVFARTRQFASLMGSASAIASYVYDCLPVYWRQGWMYRSFTGEAFTMLKEGKQVGDIKQWLWERYIKEIVEKRVEVPIVAAPVKRAYRKKNAAYWQQKTIASEKRQARNRRIQRHANILTQASQIASRIYQQVPLQERSQGYYRRLTGWAMKVLMEEEALVDNCDKDINITGLSGRKRSASFISYRNRRLYFVPPAYKRVSVTGGFDKVDVFLPGNPKTAVPYNIKNFVPSAASLASVCSTHSTKLAVT